MSVHFDFVVSDEEAETIIDCLRDEINDCRGGLVMACTHDDEPYQEWYANRIFFLEALIAKMTNRRVADEVQHRPDHVNQADGSHD